MANPTSVNSQITDAVTQANVSTEGNAPATAMGNLMIAVAQAMANAAHNATTTQQQNNITAQASTTACVKKLLSINWNADTDATAELLNTVNTKS